MTIFPGSMQPIQTIYTLTDIPSKPLVEAALRPLLV